MARGKTSAASARRSLARAREAGREAKRDAITLGSGAVAAFAWGRATRSGMTNVIPMPFGLPRALTVAALAKGVQYLVRDGDGARVLAGIGGSLGAVSLYELGRTGEMAGAASSADTPRSLEDEARAARRLAARTKELLARERLAELEGDEEDVADLIAEALDD